MKKWLIRYSFFSLIITSIQAQNTPFNLSLEPVEIQQVSGIQSFAFGQWENQWLIVGGRLDGLHRRQPWASFDELGHNKQLWVIDPSNLQVFKANLTNLPTNIIEQLSSTNMQFHQEGEYLYVIGGYGISSSAGDHSTFPNLSALHIPSLINAVKNGSDISPFIRQIEDSSFQVTGGQLNLIDSVWHLAGGQKFIGRYNPMGPDNGPGFIQKYTNSIHRFTLNDDGITITINHLPSFTDSLLLHRRDYNAEPQILPNGQEAITLFSGVFQHDENLPFLDAVTSTQNGFYQENNFSQYYNHYHCATLPAYSSISKEMHTVFFGGIAQYYPLNGLLTQDDNVPFVKTIARVTRHANSSMEEFLLPIEMPALLGAASEFIPNMELKWFQNGVLDLDQITNDSTLIGYILGGIASSQANIFFINDGSQSKANNQLFKVIMIKNNTLDTHQANTHSTSSLNMKVYPNPSRGTFYVDYHMKEPGQIKLLVSDAQGKILDQSIQKHNKSGDFTIKSKIGKNAASAPYFITLETSHEKITRQIAVIE